ncbi:YfiT family bacillithiol transferase [Flammeovirga sp. SJP92]|uniref:YfiT family bacillithiol transferase n=1 Tax=Flammeovirga sp. SJP92 TaxID=1775430 RepID=UPI000786B312|nr:putative metal-dependent hydrolase [Flammeovirga sp. SJP92]KXX71959.1 metal-dependent hydrolase [Flammeovirga sp. SJP92]
MNNSHTTLEALKYPFGQFEVPSYIQENQINLWIHEIRLFPKRVKELVKDLTKDELNLVYRPEGWSIKQVVHHCADSHMNSYIRFKLALTEENPSIRPYFEDRWAELVDSQEEDLSDTLHLIEFLHKKWTYLLERLSEEELDRTFFHPESGEQTALKENIGIYAWHCNHHLGHIKQALKYRNVFPEIVENLEAK